MINKACPIKKEDIKIGDVLIYAPNFLEKIKKNESFNVYIIATLKSKSIICKIVDYGNPFDKTKWTEIIHENLSSYSKYKDMKRNYPQYFI